MRRAVWVNGKRRVTGSWDYIWATDRFRIVLDQMDRVTGQNKSIVTAGSARGKPEWGRWLIEDTAQAIEARSGETEGLDPQGESAVGNADASDTSSASLTVGGMQ